MPDNPENYSPEKRYSYLLEQIAEHNQVWILTDEHGCVMLNSEEEDCVPIWPNESYALAWATGEWDSCKAESISIAKWQSRWTNGLLDDELCLAVFPNQDEEGLVLYPDEFDFELTKQLKKRKR